MAGQIPRDFIDTVLARTDIVELIDSRVPLKKKGSNYLACCPFHGEKTPSFNVSPTRQYYHCFGCGVSGDALEFLIQYEHLDFSDAVEELAERQGLEVPRVKLAQNAASAKNKASLLDLMEHAKDYYRQQLKTQGDSPVTAYLQKRGLSEQIINDYQLGYSPNSWDSMLGFLSSQLNPNDKNTTSTLIDSGLIIKSENSNKLFDRFMDRLMFPIRNRRGKTIGFGGRILNNNKEQAKYLNSPETPLFHKGQELYGYYEMTQAMRKIERILVVEGYMDVIALAQFGLQYAVATLGTATTDTHIEKLFKTAPEVIFCFDGDRAGRDAAWKAMSTLLPLYKPGKTAKFMFLEDGEDPDSLIRKQGKEQFEEHIGQAQHVNDFFYQSLMQQVDMDSYAGRTKLIDLAKPYLAKIASDSAFYLLMSKQLADYAEVSLGDLANILKTSTTPNQTQQITQAPTPNQTQKKYQQPFQENYQKPIKQAPAKKQSPTWKAIVYLMNSPELAQISGNPDFYQNLEEEGIEIFIRLLDLFQFDPKLNLARMLSLWDEPRQEKQLRDCLLEPILLEDKAAIEKEYLALLDLLVQKKQQRRFEQLQRIEKQHGLSKQQKQEYLHLCQRKK